MKNLFLRNIFSSIYYYRKDAVYQIIIVALLTAVITGSLMTGESVRGSLRKTAEEKLGNTDILISSGLRNFDPSLAIRLEEKTGDSTSAILELDGYCQNFSTGATALNVKIFGVNENFFRFNDGNQISLDPGSVALNKKLASQLGVNPGDEIIVRFRSVDPIPANAPFAPKTATQASKVMKVSKILDPSQSGNFSLGVSQIVPLNLFMNISEISVNNENSLVANRILISNKNKRADKFFSEALEKGVKLKDFGLSLRRSSKTGEPELISERIFIDSSIVDVVAEKIQASFPLLTYLANKISFGEKSTPYSFVSAMPSSLTKNLKDDEMIISRWVADDLGAKAGDTVNVSWFVQGMNGRLAEKEMRFYITGITETTGCYSDPSLMPDFPGISGRTTCSEWDAGIPVLLDRIRQKDEEYWNLYKGTPKAFISYKAGRKLWSNNFGTATAIRFPKEMETGEIEKILEGSIDPLRAGFTIRDVRNFSVKAAESGTDFSSLFLSLSFFILISCMILLSMAVSIFFNTREKQVRALFALGFRGTTITRMLFSEATLISVAGAIPGIFIGYLMNLMTIRALNGVWKGAVQTNTLVPEFSSMPVIYGLAITILITAALIFYKSRSFISSLNKAETGELKVHSSTRNRLYFLTALILFAGSLISAMISSTHSTILFFIAGSLLFITMVLLLRAYYLKERVQERSGREKRKEEVEDPSFYSRRYYFFNTSQAIIPVVIIASGIFAVIITAANRQVINEKSMHPGGGTGGYLLWAETAIPVKQDLSGVEGRKEFGLDEDDLGDLKIVQAERMSGDDASCLNLNHVTTPPILGLDPEAFIANGSFSFASRIKNFHGNNPWKLLGIPAGDRSINAIADQTVLEWGLKLKAGDTITVSAEDGKPLNLIICAGLRSSVFQGYLIINQNEFRRFFPSVPGSSVFLIEGKPELSDHYREVLTDRFSGYGFYCEGSGERLASFLEVTNTYLNVFTVLGAFGMILGIAGLGFVLLRNFNQRKREFALLAATGFSQKKIRELIFKDHTIILFCGILTGTLSGLISTIPSILSGNEISWIIIAIMILLIAVIGLATLLLAARGVRNMVLITQLRKE